MNKDVHPALLKKDTTVVNLRTVPNDLHAALRKAAIDAELSLEQFIINGLPKLLK